MSRANRTIFVFGASGHAKVVIDIIEREKKYSISHIIDDDLSLNGKLFLDYTVSGGREIITAESVGPGKAIVAVGDNKARREVGEWLQEQHIQLVSTVHPSAQLGWGVTIGAGSVIMANAVINPASIVGRNVIINTGATVDHDCVVGDNVHIAPGCILCGTVRVGEGSFIGAGSTVIQNITIGRNVIIRAGTVVVENIPDNAK